MEPIRLPERYKYIAAMLTMRCNLDCSYCLNRFSKTGGESFDRRSFKEISGAQWVEALNRIEPRKGTPVTLSGGEPMIHKDFIYIVNNVRPDLEIDILTNLSSDSNVERFIREVNPERLKRDSPYPPIRVSYHPEQMGDGDKLVQNVTRVQKAGFRVGVFAVQYPSPEQLEAITQMQFRCLNKGIDFRVKDYTGRYESVDDSGAHFCKTYGNYSKYPGSAFQDATKDCLCRTSELLIGTDAGVYRCHRDMFSAEYPIGSLLNPLFQIEDRFRECRLYGKCHPCDVKVKTDSKQQLGHTSVEIKDVGDRK